MRLLLGVVDGDKLREFLMFNIDAKVTIESCKMLILYINGLEGRLASTFAIHSIVLTLKLLAQGRQCLLTPPNDDEDSYNAFCESVHHVQKILTDESRSARIMSRTLKIAKREEKQRKKCITPINEVHSTANAAPAANDNHFNWNIPPIQASTTQHTSAQKQKHGNNNMSIKNMTSLAPLVDKVRDLNGRKGKNGDNENHKESSHSSNKENKKKGKSVVFSSQTQGQTAQTASQSNEKQLGHYVSHSTGVSNPGGASSILRAKTPLILDRPSNIRDRMTVAVGGVALADRNRGDPDDVSVTSCSSSTTGGGVGGKKSKKRDTVCGHLDICFLLSQMTSLCVCVCVLVCMCLINC